MRYVIDVTQLVHWPGNLTGIPRVMDELAVRFLNDTNVEAIFVSWVKELGVMCEVDFAKNRPHRGEGIDYILKHQDSNVAQHVDVNETSVQSLTPIRFAKKAAKKTIVKTRLDRTPLYRRVITAKRKLEVQAYKAYTPQSEDSFFIPWGEWWDANWLSLVQEYASEGVAVYPICHDILPMVVPQFSGNSSSLAEFIKHVFPISTTILTVSESTKRDLAAWMKSQGLQAPPIKSFRLGEDFSYPRASIDESRIVKKYDIKKENYIIYVSTVEPRKNHTLLYYTYKLARSRGITLPKLLIVGRIGHDTASLVRSFEQDPEINQSIRVCTGVDDSELNWLYENCLFTVMPSFYEGWGMTVLESIARGKPVACSNTSSLLEMPNDCVLRFNPASTDECLNALATLMKPEVQNKYRGSARAYKPHPWDRSYEQVLTILKESKHA